MFKQLHINISLADALILIPKYQKMLKALISNKEKLLELANTPLNENCLAVILKKLPKKLGDPGKFLIPCSFSELNCKALADLGASINLMPLSVWKKLSLSELISTRMTLELANRSVCTPVGIAWDVFVLVGRPFLRTARALIDVHGEELILRDGDERLILNMKHGTSSYSNKHKKESINMIDIYNISYEDYLEDLFANEKITNHLSGNPTFSSEPDTLTSDLTSPEVKDDIFDPEGDIVLIEKLLNLDSTKDLPPPPNVNPLSGSTTSSSPSLTTSEISDYSLEEFADELALIESFPPGNDDMTREDVDTLTSTDNEDKVFNPGRKRLTVTYNLNNSGKSGIKTINRIDNQILFTYRRSKIFKPIRHRLEFCAIVIDRHVPDLERAKFITKIDNPIIFIIGFKDPQLDETPFEITRRGFVFDVGFESKASEAPLAGPKPVDMTDAKFNSQDEKAHSIILLSLSDEVLYKLADEETAAGSTLKDHLDALNSILMDLKNVKVKIDDEDAALILLVSLPPLFENFVNSFVVGAVAKYESGSERDVVLALVYYKGTSLVWIMDFACSFHMSPNQDWFLIYEEFDGGHVFMGVLDSKGFKYTSKNGVLRVSEGALVVMKATKGNSYLYTLQGDMIIGFTSPATDIDCKTPIEVWFGKPADYSKLRVFGCPVYYHVSEGVLDLGGEKGIFMGYGDGVEHVVLGDMNHDVASPDDQPNSPHLKHEQDRSIAHDRPRRNSKAHSQFSFEDYVAYALQVAEEVETLEPTTYREAITSKESDMWSAAMGEEIEYLHKNKTWELVQLPERRKVAPSVSLIYLLLYVDDMLAAAKDIEEVNKLKILLNTEFDMKDLGVAQSILGMEILRD
ncbi:reverse transcriptase domain-containing protein [Tanacetum coccineum]